jgi:hypothetical protein
VQLACCGDLRTDDVVELSVLELRGPHASVTSARPQRFFPLRTSSRAVLEGLVSAEAGVQEANRPPILTHHR